MKQAQIDVLKQGLIAGSLGYFAITFYYALINIVDGRSPFHTVTVIGQALFHPENVVAAIIAYNGLHLSVFLLVGLFAAWLVYRVDQEPGVWHAALFALIALFLFASCAVAIVAGELAHISAGVVLPGNLGAAIVVGSYLGWAHPGLERRVELFSDSELLEASA
jgi:hypothetical protein